MSRVEFSPVAGGPFYDWLCRVRLVRDARLRPFRADLVLLLFALGPVLVLSAVERAWTGRVDGLLTDFSVYARFVVAVPLFLAGERAMHVRCARTIRRFIQGGFAADEQHRALERSLARAERLRDWRAVELGILAVAFALGQASLWGTAAFVAPLQGGADPGSITAARVWYGTIALPLFQFLLVRWLWRWVIWSRVLWDISRLRLRLMPTHPDHCGGIELLCDPTFAFAFFVAGSHSVVASVWATRIAFGGAALADFAVPFALLSALAALIAYAPLLCFLPTMVRERFLGIHEYGRLALVHARLFHRRWVEQEIDDSLLGSPDISSLQDLTTAYESMARMRVVPFGLRSIMTVAVGVVAPMIPLVALEIPLSELLLRIGKTLFLGLPP